MKINIADIFSIGWHEKHRSNSTQRRDTKNSFFFYEVFNRFNQNNSSENKLPLCYHKTTVFSTKENSIEAVWSFNAVNVLKNLTYAVNNYVCYVVKEKSEG